MVDAFAAAQDLADRLKRDFTPDESAWIDTLLADASAYLRGQIGQRVYPQTTSTFTGYPTSGRVDLPQVPIASVGAVERDGVAVDFKYRPGYILLEQSRDIDEPVDVTFTWGFVTAPEELLRLACVLVSGALLTLENGIGLTAGGLSSVALDDFKLAWADAGAASGMVLSDITIDSIRAQFGYVGVHVVSAVG